MPKAPVEVIEVKVYPSASAVTHLHLKFLGGSVANHRRRVTGFHHTEHTNRVRLNPVGSGNLFGDGLFTQGTGVQVMLLDIELIGYGFTATVDLCSHGFGPLAKIFVQNPVQ